MRLTKSKNKVHRPIYGRDIGWNHFIHVFHLAFVSLLQEKYVPVPLRPCLTIKVADILHPDFLLFRVCGRRFPWQPAAEARWGTKHCHNTSEGVSEALCPRRRYCNLMCRALKGHSHVILSVILFFCKIISVRVHVGPLLVFNFFYLVWKSYFYIKCLQLNISRKKLVKKFKNQKRPKRKYRTGTDLIL
jgi:hypothetical protein